jgi:hypothetical protein
MTGKRMTMVHVENDEPAAQIVVGYLRSQGIEALISEDDAGDQIPALEAARGVRVFVPAGDAERARALLAEREGVGEGEELPE